MKQASAVLLFCLVTFVPAHAAQIDQKISILAQTPRRLADYKKTFYNKFKDLFAKRLYEITPEKNVSGEWKVFVGLAPIAIDPHQNTILITISHEGKSKILKVTIPPAQSSDKTESIARFASSEVSEYILKK